MHTKEKRNPVYVDLRKNSGLKTVFRMCHSKVLILLSLVRYFLSHRREKKLQKLLSSQEQQENRLFSVPVSDVRLILLIHFQE